MEEKFIRRNNGFQLEKNPLMIDLVLTSTFEFLNVETLKSCRLVCTLWKEISSYHLRKLSRIVFSPKDSKDEVCWEKFQKTFPKFYRLFTTIRMKLHGRISFRNFQEILTERKEFVSDLELRNVLLTDDIDGNISTYDISHFIPDILESFCLVNNSNGYTHFMVSSEKLIFLEKLDLYRGTVILGDKASISATEMTLDHVLFTRDTFLSDFVDFSQVKKLIFRDISNKADLNFGDDNFCLKTRSNVTLDLCHANIFDSNWCVDQLRVSKIDFEKYFSNLRQLTIRCSSLDLSALPSTMEILNLGPNTETICSQPIFFNFLRSLTLVGNIMSSVVHFSHCPKLKKLTLAPHHEGPCNVNLSDIPAKIEWIKVLQDYHCKIEWTGELAHQLDTLVISDYKWEHLISVVLQKIQPSHLVLNINSVSATDSQIVSLVQNSLISFFAVGPIYWKDDEDSIYPGLQRFSEKFENSPLYSMVNCKSPYYLFNNNQGIAIEKQEFYNMLAPAYF